MTNAAAHPFLANEEGVDTHDDDPSNMMIRAGYLFALSLKSAPGTDDRKMLQRASRSLVLAARA